MVMGRIEYKPKVFFAALQAFWPSVFLGVLWITLVAWRPAFFGFYHDDWSSVAVPLDRSSDLASLLAADPSRPLYIIVLYILRWLLSGKVVLWQSLLAFVHFLNAIAIYRLAGYLFSSAQPERSRVPSVVGAALWLLYPWSLGYSAWAIMLPPDIGMLLAVSGMLMVMRPGLDLKRVYFAILLLVLSWLIYEATWMLWLPFSLVLLMRARKSTGLRPVAWRFFWGSLLAQVVFIILNRVISAQSSHGKKLSASILALLDTDRYLFVNQLLPSLWSYQFIGYSLLLLLACLLLNVRRCIALPARGWVLFCMILGLAVSQLLYAAAGYAIEWTGLFSRVTLPVSFWLSLAFASLFSMAWSGARPYVKTALVVALAGVAVPLSYSLVEQSSFWAKSWEEQQNLLKMLPQNVTSVVGEDRMLVVDAPRGTPPVFTFSAYWDISAALVPYVPAYANEKRPHEFATMLRKDEWRTTWDGEVLTQYWCTSRDIPLWKLDAKHVYLWRYPAQQATALTAPYDSGCGTSSAKK
jgi:hypothetical protein